MLQLGNLLNYVLFFQSVTETIPACRKVHLIVHRLELRRHSVRRCGHPPLRSTCSCEHGAAHDSCSFRLWSVRALWWLPGRLPLWSTGPAWRSLRPLSRKWPDPHVFRRYWRPAGRRAATEMSASRRSCLDRRCRTHPRRRWRPRDSQTPQLELELQQ